ncbi:Uncharacterized protein FWK35_00015110 [Aphis craccivora]|uniref:Uncharacterized protein n=1 Tax=Aphis craccivora TaxID=307492 RepID=A0A6G0ZBQ9_APHCR|nr:Uncharacterized protein FWK35_00015110 [Aphis craccivora]
MLIIKLKRLSCPLAGSGVLVFSGAHALDCSSVCLNQCGHIYGLRLWGNVKKSNINKIQAFQNFALRNIKNVLPYVSNFSLHLDLKLKTIPQPPKYSLNPLIKNLSSPTYLLIPQDA